MKTTLRPYLKTLLLVSVIAITCTAYAPSLQNSFTNWDDDIYLTDNFMTWNLSWNNVGRFFTFEYCPLYLDYQPLTLLSYALEYHFFKLNPLAYHATNLLLHLINCGLVFWLILLLGAGEFTAWFCALLFGIHPMHVESVAWVAERKDVLYGMFFLGGLISYIAYKDRRSALWYGTTAVMLVLSLLSKIMAVSFPLALFAIDYIRGDRLFTLRSLKEKSPFFAIAVAGGYCISQAIPKRQEFLFSLANNILIASNAVVFYIGKLFLPLRLCAIYPYPDPANGIPPFSKLIWLAPPITLFIVAAVLFSMRYTKKVAFGACFFFATILPVLQLIPGAVIAADRYTYLPFIGLFYVFGEAIRWLYRAARPAIGKTLVCVIAIGIAAFSILTWQRCSVWKDSISFWEDMLKRYPRYTGAYAHLGTAYSLNGDFKRSIENFDRALEINPALPDVYNNRGYTYYRMGEYDKALADYSASIRINPRSAEAFNNRGYAYAVLKNDFPRAIADYAEAIRLNPLYAHAYNNRGNAYQSMGDLERAIADYTRTLEVDPGYVDAYINRGIAYCKKGDLTSGIAEYNAALALQPGNPKILNNRGLALHALGRNGEAIADLDAAVASGIQDPHFLNNRGTVHAACGRFDLALADFDAALRLAPGSGRFYANRAFALYSLGKYQEAAANAQQAQQCGFTVNPALIEDIRKKSGQ